MKNLKSLVVILITLFSFQMKSQVSVNVNIGSPPLWGPVGYTETRYYYIPDVESYYDVESSMFIYYADGIWIRRANLPGRYRNYDLYNGYKVVINDYRGNDPYVHFHDHKIKYKKGYRGGPQKTIGARPERAIVKGKGNNENHNDGNQMRKGGNGNGQHSDHGKKGGKGKK